MCSLSPGNGVGRCTGGSEEAAAGAAAATGARAGWTLDAAGALAGALAALAASVVPAPRRVGLVLLWAPPSVLASASVLARVAVTSMVNKVLAGLRITPRFGVAVCLPGVQTNCRPFTGQTRH